MLNHGVLKYFLCVSVQNAMNVVGMSVEKQQNVLEIISAILHLGNIRFVEDNNVSDVENPEGKYLNLDSSARLRNEVVRMSDVSEEANDFSRYYIHI